MRALLVTLGLASSVAAQSQFTSPPGVGPDGDSVVSSLQPFNVAANGRRFQYIVNDIRGVPSASGEMIHTIALRPDPASAPSTARTADVTIVMDHVDFAALSPTFSNNYSGSQTTDALGTLNLPATVGTSGFVIAFPLSRPFTYFGSRNLTNPMQTALLVEFQTTSVVGGTTYSLDCADGTESPVAGTSNYLGLQPCVVPPNLGGFDIVRHGPTTSGGLTTIGQHALRGPPLSFGILSLGLTDPNTDFGGLLCAPLRASPDISVNVTSNAQGAVGGFANPWLVTFPDLAGMQRLRVFTQFVLFDAARGLPQLSVSLSDAIEFDVLPPTSIERRTIYATASSMAGTGTLTVQFVPVMRFN